MRFVKTLSCSCGGFILVLGLVSPPSFAAPGTEGDQMLTCLQDRIKESKNWENTLKDRREACREKRKAGKVSAEDERCGGDKYWQGPIGEAEIKTRYYTDMRSLVEKALRSPAEHGAVLLSAVISGVGAKKIDIKEIGSFFPFFMRNDADLKGLMTESFPMSMRTVWPPEKKNESMETRFLDTFLLNGRKNGIFVSEKGQNWSATQEINIVDQGETNGWKSRRVGGNLRIWAKDGTLIASWNNSSGGTHLAAEEAEMQGAENLANSALHHIMFFLLERTADRREKE